MGTRARRFVALLLAVAIGCDDGTSDDPQGPPPNPVIPGRAVLQFHRASHVADEPTATGVPRLLQVDRVGSASQAASVKVRVSGGTATLDSDYRLPAESASGEVVLQWSAGDGTPKVVQFVTLDDAVVEGGGWGEGINFVLSDPVGPEVVLHDTLMSAGVWIYDDDLPTAARLHSLAGHPMPFYVSLPQGWNASRAWPVVFAIDGAGRWYRGMIEQFRAARGTRDFILVTPVTLSNGYLRDSTGGFQQALLEYFLPPLLQTFVTAPPAEMCEFDDDEIMAIHQEIRTLYRGEDKFFITGHSGGGIPTFRIAARHPGKLVAASPTCPNFDEPSAGTASTDPARVALPIVVFQGADDEYLDDILEREWQGASAFLGAHDFQGLERRMIPGLGHEDPYAGWVLDFFATQ